MAFKLKCNSYFNHFPHTILHIAASDLTKTNVVMLLPSLKTSDESLLFKELNQTSKILKGFSINPVSSPSTPAYPFTH